jgi:hypothetical protein
MNQKDFNQKFVDHIRSGEKNPELASLIKDSPRLSALRALEVYQEDYEARLSEALANSYRAVHSIVGDDDFYQLARDYLKIYPSSSSDLDDYGDQMSAFLSTHSLNEDYGFLSELAHFEWSFRNVFHKQEEWGLNANELQEYLTAEATSVRLIQSAQLLHYHYLIDKIYSLSESDEESEIDIEHEQYLVMFKRGVMVKTHSLSKNQSEIMKKFQTPATLLSALQSAPATVTPEEIQELFLILGKEQMLLKSE